MDPGSPGSKLQGVVRIQGQRLRVILVGAVEVYVFTVKDLS